MLATASGDGTVRLWDVRNPLSPEAIGSPLQSAGGTVYVVSFSPDGRTLAAPNDDGTTGLWDVSNPEAASLLTPPPLAGPAGPVRTSAFSPDGKLLAVGSDDKTVWLWNVSDPSNPRNRNSPAHRICPSGALGGIQSKRPTSRRRQRRSHCPSLEHRKPRAADLGRAASHWSHRCAVVHCVRAGQSNARNRKLGRHRPTVEPPRPFPPALPRTAPPCRQ